MTRWMDQANCRSSDAELFVPAEDVAHPSYAAARWVCAGCTVRAECLAYALDQDIVDGMWGGLAPYERRSLRRITEEASR